MVGRPFLLRVSVVDGWVRVVGIGLPGKKKKTWTVITTQKVAKMRYCGTTVSALRLRGIWLVLTVRHLIATKAGGTK